jgi:hypothetical protein
MILLKNCWVGIKQHRIRGEHANHYTTDVYTKKQPMFEIIDVLFLWKDLTSTGDRLDVKWAMFSAISWGEQVTPLWHEMMMTNILILLHNEAGYT